MRRGPLARLLAAAALAAAAVGCGFDEAADTGTTFDPPTDQDSAPAPD